jgi:thymidylate synthase (FAD)
MLTRIEEAGRTCYKSEDKITSDSARRFVANIIKRGHESVIEHEKVTVRVICDRGVSHEIVRHRLASYSQESTRYCNYAGGVTFVIPPWVNIDPGEYRKFSALRCDGTVKDSDVNWALFCLRAEATYIELLNKGWSPQQARSVLPNSLKTEIVMTMNLREWRHFFRLRTSDAAHPQMQEIARPMLRSFKDLVPVVFDDLKQTV